MKHIEELRDMLCEELEKIIEDGEITTGSLDIIDKLTHSIKSIDTIMAMDGYSNDYRYDYDRSYARRKRDSRGRYSRNKRGMTDRLETMMDESDDPAVRQALQNALNHLEDER